MSKAIDPVQEGLYAADLHAWSEAQARALRDGRFASLDHEHLREVLDRLGQRERREVKGRLGVILTGLLRWSEQVDLRCHGWAATLDIQRMHVARLLRDNPSLRPALPTLVAGIYSAAKARAVLESALFDDSFSDSCPFSEEEILLEGFFPDPYGDDAIRGAGWWKRQVLP